MSGKLEDKTRISSVAVGSTSDEGVPQSAALTVVSKLYIPLLVDAPTPPDEPSPMAAAAVDPVSVLREDVGDVDDATLDVAAAGAEDAGEPAVDAFDPGTSLTTLPESVVFCFPHDVKPMTRMHAAPIY